MFHVGKRIAAAYSSVPWKSSTGQVEAVENPGGFIASFGVDFNALSHKVRVMSTFKGRLLAKKNKTYKYGVMNQYGWSHLGVDDERDCLNATFYSATRGNKGIVRNPKKGPVFGPDLKVNGELGSTKLGTWYHGEMASQYTLFGIEKIFLREMEVYEVVVEI